MSLFSQDPNKKALQEEAQAYRKLQSLGMTEEFKEFSDRLVKTAADKMIYAFTSDSIKSWEDYCRVKGEIIARLQPLQEVFESRAVAMKLEENLKEYYANAENLTQ